MRLGCRDTKVCFSMLFGRRGVDVVFKQVCNSYGILRMIWYENMMRICKISQYKSQNHHLIYPEKASNWPIGTGQCSRLGIKKRHFELEKAEDSEIRGAKREHWVVVVVRVLVIVVVAAFEMLWIDATCSSLKWPPVFISSRHLSAGSRSGNRNIPWSRLSWCARMCWKCWITFFSFNVFRLWTFCSVFFQHVCECWFPFYQHIVAVLSEFCQLCHGWSPVPLDMPQSRCRVLLERRGCSRAVPNCLEGRISIISKVFTMLQVPMRFKMLLDLKIFRDSVEICCAIPGQGRLGPAVQQDLSTTWWRRNSGILVERLGHPTTHDAGRFASNLKDKLNQNHNNFASLSVCHLMFY